ncbi:hypothetical protein ACH4PW_00520 [Streptomyces sp. NPDC017082]|uniref:hypothetical protein n=1 Tax=Streptomyces sp. NPDC017082 TaxID=3364974 RepID=UPI0037957E58
MRETPDTVRKRIDLSVPQVAASALAAVVAAKLASYFGVYGTILGAGVVSAVATCGGTVFQHFFKRTGEQLRERTAATVRPRDQAPPPPSGEFTAGTVYRARARGLRRPLIAAALVFGVTMTGITVYELASGNSFSGGTGTTVGHAVTGRDSSRPKTGETPAPAGTPSPEHTPAPGGTASGDSPTPGGSPSGQPDEQPDGEPSSGTPSGSPATPVTPVPTPSAPGTSVPAPTLPEPSASSRSGTGVPGPDGPAAR